MNQATHNKIVSFIWGIADDVLRDLFKRGKYPDVILPMCVIRRMDAVLEPTKQAVLTTKKLLDDNQITAQDADRLFKRIHEDIAPKVAADAAYQNAKTNTPHTARQAHDQALSRVMQMLLLDDTQFYKLFMENEEVKRFVAEKVYELTRKSAG
jgi:type I restriction-modification system DNA methylase subunit